MTADCACTCLHPITQLYTSLQLKQYPSTSTRLPEKQLAPSNWGARQEPTSAIHSSYAHNLLQTQSLPNDHTEYTNVRHLAYGLRCYSKPVNVLDGVKLATSTLWASFSNIPYGPQHGHAGS
jgi:hypothetical protein